MILGFAFYQIIIFALTAFLLIRAFLKLLAKQKNIREFIISCVFWGNASLLALYPSVIDRSAKFIGFQEGVNAIFALLLFFIIYFTINLVKQNEKTERTITNLVREMALKDIENKDK